MQAMMGRNNCTCQGERSKAQLMETIGQSAFAAYDTLLYMDTHPQDQEAMAYYHKQGGIRREAMEEYARRFGPLTMDLIDETDCHSWECSHGHGKDPGKAGVSVCGYMKNDCNIR